MKHILKILLMSFIFFVLPLQAKTIKYPIADIPKELKENARSVIRNEEIKFEITSISSAKLKVTYAISILNKNGIDDSRFLEFYDKTNKISGISGKIYNENGEQIKKIKSDDIIDASAISGYTAYDDNRMKIIFPKELTPPFTIEYSYERSFDGLISYPTWNPIRDYNISVQSSSFTVLTPLQNTLRYYELNLPQKVVQSQDKKENSYSWSIQNYKALREETLSPSNKNFMPTVFIAPDEFEYENFKGNFKDWQSFGEWIFNLNKNRNNLSVETKNKIKELTAPYSTDFEKINCIYQYMQNKTRYVSIQLGIGGYQPMLTANVDRLGYGDCKALSFYMKSLLEAVNIQSYYCLVSAGSNATSTISDFPSNQFNHIILCVPIKNDTLWLECTNQRMPCGYIGDFTDDRDVLLIDSMKSKIVHTKIYSPNNNIKSRYCWVNLNTDSCKAIIKTNYKGLNYEDVSDLLYADEKDKKNKILSSISLPQFNLIEYKHKENQSIIPSIDQIIKLNFQNFTINNGNRLLLPLNFSNKSDIILERIRNRKTDVFIRRPNVEIDTTEYTLPKGYSVETIPTDINIESQFGKYFSKTKVNNNKIYYIRQFEIYKGTYPAAQYNDLLAFIEKVHTADAIKCPLKK